MYCIPTAVQACANCLAAAPGFAHVASVGGGFGGGWGGGERVGVVMFGRRAPTTKTTTEESPDTLVDALTRNVSHHVSPAGLTPVTN